MKRKRLILDLDDVLGDLLTPWLEKYNEIWGDNLKHSDINDWDLTKFTKPESGKEIYSLLKPVNNTSLWDNMKPMEDAVNIVYLLNKLMDIFVVSSVTGDYSIIPYKHNWLMDNFPFLDSKNFYFVSNKEAVCGDFMVDDYYKNMESFNGTRILFDRPHNQHVFAEVAGWSRAKDWKDVYDIIVGEL